MREAAMVGDTETQFFLGMIYAVFDVRLMSVDDASELSAEGARLVVVAEVDNDHLHLRIFDPDGELVADRAKPELPNKAVELDELRR